MSAQQTLIQHSNRALICASLAVCGWMVAQPAIAQRINPKIAADAVYSQLPELPKENQYQRKKGNKPATNSTLVSRFIQYHTLVKGRSPQYRFDWKITLADYLGLYENLREEQYPGHAFLKESAMEGDRKLIRQLTRKQRLALTQILSDLYASQAPQQQAAPSAEKSQPESAKPANPEPEPITRPKIIPLPSSGSADLLRPQAPPKSSSPQSTTPARKPTGEAQKLSF